MFCGDLPESGQTTALVLVGLMVVAIPLGLGLAQGLTSPTVSTEEVLTPTLLPINQTPTPTPRPTPTTTKTPPRGNDTTLVVDKTSGSGGLTSDAGCADAEYQSIQRAVEEASPGYTVVVCAGTYPEQVVVNTGNITLRAKGTAVIENPGGSAVRITTSQVTIRGFVIRATTEDGNVIEVGGRDAHVRNNTVEPTGPGSTGIFLSDGHTAQGDTDPELEVASGSYIVNNTVNAGAQTQYGIWTDADQTNIQNNKLNGGGNTTSILSSGNETIIRNNTVRYPDRRQQGAGIKIGESPQKGHNFATRNVVGANSVSGGPERGIVVGLQPADSVAQATIIRDNTVLTSGMDTVDWPGAISTFSNETVIRNNTVLDSGHADPSRTYPARPVDGVKIVADDVLVIGNTIKRNQDGLSLSGYDATIKRNTMANNSLDGMDSYGYSSEPASGRVLNNTMVGNAGAGIRLNDRPGAGLEAHSNRIWDNSGGGIINYNFDLSDGEWPIMNATHNIWDCGGPSSGLEDPETGRIANGTGDPVSAGDKPGVSNVHFDPFLERSGCTSTPSTPTATPTQTPTVTPTPTSTATPTPTPTAAASLGEHGGDGAGTDEGNGDALGPDREGDSQGDGTSEGTPPPSPPTETSSEPPTPTISPTPVVEPGFSVLTWFIGIVLLGGLVAFRRQMTSNTEGDND